MTKDQLKAAIDRAEDAAKEIRENLAVLRIALAKLNCPYKVGEIIKFGPTLNKTGRVLSIKNSMGGDSWVVGVSPTLKTGKQGVFVSVYSVDRHERAS